jgi:NDP-sugar pyrophosphorylase family protein
MAEKVEAAIGHDYQGMRIAYAVEPSPLGTAGAVRAALPLLSGRTVLLMNGDSYCGVDLGVLRASHRRRNAEISLVLARRRNASRFGAVRVSAGGRVVGFAEKRRSGGISRINAGVYLIQTKLLAEIPSGRFVSLEKEMFPAWIGCKAFFGFRSAARFLDIGTPESYALAEQFFAPRIETTRA